MALQLIASNDVSKDAYFLALASLEQPLLTFQIFFHLHIQFLFKSHFPKMSMLQDSKYFVMKFSFRNFYFE